MNTLKSACLVVVLLGVLYGVYVALNKPDLPGPAAPAAREEAPLTIEYGSPTAAVPGATNFSPQLTVSQDAAQSPAAGADRSVRGGTFQPNFDTGAMPPPPAQTPPVNGGLSRSAYEAPLSSPATEVGSGVSAANHEAAPPLTPVAPSSNPAPALAAYDLKRDLAEAEQLVASGKFKTALARLTPHYASANLPADQRSLLLSWLDALAGKVIYSREHLLASPHQVRKGEDLYQIAKQYNVEYRLLQNINHREVSDPLILIPATELKVVPGPFRAQVNLASQEITLLVDELYAGRFSFVLGDQPPQPGDYKVIDKRAQQKTYVGFDGRVIPANDPANPYGGWWISLGGEVAIHGSPTAAGDKTLGCISLSPQDARDLYGILSIDSEVKVQ